MGCICMCGGGQGLDFRKSYRICTVVVALAIFSFLFSSLFSPRASLPHATADDTFFSFLFPFRFLSWANGGPSQWWGLDGCFLVALLKE